MIVLQAVRTLLVDGIAGAVFFFVSKFGLDIGSLHMALLAFKARCLDTRRTDKLSAEMELA